MKELYTCKPDKYIKYIWSQIDSYAWIQEKIIEMIIFVLIEDEIDIFSFLSLKHEE